MRVFYSFVYVRTTEDWKMASSYFHPCDVVRHFPVLQIPVTQIGFDRDSRWSGAVKFEFA